MKWTWRDVSDVAAALAAEHAQTDPLNVTLGELRRLVLALPEFQDDPEAATSEILLEIQEAWYDVREG